MEETYQNIHMKKEDEEVNNSKWDMIQEGEDSESSSTTDHSSMASSSCLSTDDNEVLEDASSSSSSANGPLFHLTDLMNQLPTMRRGLSKHYKGKSQSFTSLAHVKNLEDLAKKVSPYGTISSSYDRISSRRRMMKSCKSYAVFAEATIT